MRRISFAQRFIAYLCCLSLNVPVLAQAHTIGPNGPIPVERAPLPLPAPESLPESRPVPPPVTKPVNTPMPAPVHVPAESETAGKRNKEIYYIHTDHLNTPRAITNGEQKKVWKWGNVDPFGKNVANENPEGRGRFAFNLRFPGQYYDRETGLHYNWHRDYDPVFGRYVQSDPIGLEGGLNIYGYTGGNPIKNTDPSGEFFVPLVGMLSIPAIYSGLSGAAAAALGTWLGQLLGCNPIDSKAIMLATLLGFITAAMAPFLGPIGLSVVGSSLAALQELNGIIDMLNKGQKITSEEIMARMFISTLFGGMAGLFPWVSYAISSSTLINLLRMNMANHFFGGGFLGATTLGTLGGAMNTNLLDHSCRCK